MKDDYYGTTLGELQAAMNRNVTRVAVHPATDLFMMRAELGDLVSVGREYVTVKFDKLAKPKRVAPYLLRIVE